MLRMIRKLWADDRGAVMASELLFLYTMLVVGTVSGLTAMRQAVVSELTETAQSLLALNQSYSFSGQSIAGLAFTAGSSAVDQSNTISAVGAAAASPAVVSQVPCE
ncbi:MAG TPA: hypothetical protein VFW33_15205 [Gemmataceae bacterium]|nr:hypothetical protein [Gemmataceae bacterium]